MPAADAGRCGQFVVEVDEDRARDVAAQVGLAARTSVEVPPRVDDAEVGFAPVLGEPLRRD